MSGVLWRLECSYRYKAQPSSQCYMYVATGRTAVLEIPSIPLGFVITPHVCGGVKQLVLSVCPVFIIILKSWSDIMSDQP